MANLRRMYTVKGGYDKNGCLVRTTVPCTAVEYHDGGDDELCVWDLARPGEGARYAANISSKPTEPVATASRITESAHSLLAQRLEEARAIKRRQESEASHQRTSASATVRDHEDDTEAVKLLAHAADTLNKVSQFMLKVEVRMGQATKQAIRQTLDDTVEHHQVCDSQQRMQLDRLTAQVDRLSEDIYRRLHVVDRVLRGKKGEGLVPLRESEVKSWLDVETNDTRRNSHDPCYFTASDLASGRSFAEWADYLKEHCGFPTKLKDEAKLVELAWRLLDRNLRGSKPCSNISIDGFVDGLERDYRNAKFEEALRCSSQQEEEDVVAWMLLRRLWSARRRP